MPEELAILLVVGVVVWALLELLQTEPAAVRVLPRWVWVVLIIALPPLGAVAWFLLGRPRPDQAGPVPARALRGRRAWVSRPAPDDDPEFLALLNARADQQRRLRRLEEDFGSDEPDSDRPE